MVRSFWPAVTVTVIPDLSKAMYRGSSTPAASFPVAVLAGSDSEE